MQGSLFEQNGSKVGRCGSGRKLENQVALLLMDSGWEIEKQYQAGFRVGKKTRHSIDIRAEKEQKEILVSCKYQDVVGTAPDKLPYEYMCILKAVEECLLTRGFLVLFGKELKKHNMFADNEISRYMRVSPKVVVCEFEEFTRLVIREQLFVGLGKDGQRELW